MGHSAWEDSKRVTRWLGLGSFEGILTHVSGGFCWQLAENLARILAGILIHELFLENIALIFFLSLNVLLEGVSNLIYYIPLRKLDL